MVKVVTLSILITCCISLGVGYALSSFIPFLHGVVAAFVLQFVAFYFIKEKAPAVAEEDNTLEEIISLQTVNVTCPCNNNTFPATVFCGIDNIFVCDKCKSRFRVELSHDSILLTEPVNLENAFNALKGKELTHNNTI